MFKGTPIHNFFKFLSGIILALGLALVFVVFIYPLKRHSKSNLLPVILISIDGFRSEYLRRNQSPHISKLIKGGVCADGLVPVFPSLTFPNHFSMVTGVLPEKHGIVASHFFDFSLNKKFKSTDPEIVSEPYWWAAEPIWVTAERKGILTAPIFWPGSTAEINGVRPKYFEKFSSKVSNADRVKKILDLLDLPSEIRPQFLTLYIDEVDVIGHRFGPNSPEILRAIRSADAAVGELVSGLSKRNLLATTDLIVVSDHGMVATSNARNIYLEDYISLATVTITSRNTFAGIAPKKNTSQKVFSALSKASAHFRAYHRDYFPHALHYKNSHRIPPILLLPDFGWRIFSTRSEARLFANERGSHGWDPLYHEELNGIFIATGPSFKRGVRVEAFQNIKIYSLLIKLLGLKSIESMDPALVAFFQ